MLLFNKQKGVTLVELIISIVIISIAAIALLQGLGMQTQRNVDPMIQSQAQLLAKQYLKEVSSKSFFDPSADPRLDQTLSQAMVVSSIINTVQRTASPTNRLTWDNLYEYNNYSTTIQDVSGAPINTLSGYAVNISVDISTGLSLGTSSNSVLATCPAKIALITVVITDPRNQTTELSGYRTSYFDPSIYVGC